MPPYYWQSYICRGPQSLWQWDQIEAENRHKREPESEPLPYVDGYLPEPASAIRLARECDIPHILPAAFYHLSRLSIYDDWAEARQCLDIHSSRYEGLDLGRRTAKWSLLTANDFISLPKGRAKLRVAAAERRVFELDNHESEDHSSSGCSSLKRSELLLEIRKACRYSRDILLTTREYMERSDFSDNVCQYCCSRIRDSLSRFRRHLWVKLPDFLSLE